MFKKSKNLRFASQYPHPSKRAGAWKTIVTVAAMLMNSMAGADQKLEWFKTAPSACASFKSFPMSLFDSIGLPPFSELSGVGATRYVQVKRSALVALQTSQFEIVQTRNLSASDIGMLRQAIDQQAEATKIPFIIGELGTNAVNALLSSISPAAGLGGSALWDHYVASLNGRLDVLSTMRSLITSGGTMNYVLGLKYVPGSSDLLLASQEYHIQVGAELQPRNYIVGVCIYPYEVIVDDFETVAQSGNKIVKRTTGNSFTVWDVEGQKYDNYKLQYEFQDRDFYYFRRDKDTEYRISMWGGLWQTHDYSSSDWGTLYTKVDSK